MEATRVAAELGAAERDEPWDVPRGDVPLVAQGTGHGAQTWQPGPPPCPVSGSCGALTPFDPRRCAAQGLPASSRTPPTTAGAGPPRPRSAVKGRVRSDAELHADVCDYDRCLSPARWPSRTNNS
jgi:hypothetical protein